MPDLVYNVKFNIDQPSPQQMPSGVGGGVGAPGSTGREGNRVDDLTNKVRRYTEILNRHNNVARTSGKVTQKQRLSYELASRTLEGYRDDLLQASSAVENLSTKQIQNLNTAVSRSNKSLGSARSHIQGMGNSMSGMNKIGNNTNQILFSFGDAIQDSAQFTQGFASGMRAVGNNLTFAAEQFIYARKQAGSFGGALKQMRQQMMGPVGVIVGFNAVVTAMTVIPQLMKNSSEEGSKLASTFSELFDEMSKAAIQFEDPFNLRAAEIQISLTKATIDSLTVSVDDVTKSAAESAFNYKIFSTVLKGDVGPVLKDAARSFLAIRSETDSLNKSSDMLLGVLAGLTAAVFTAAGPIGTLSAAILGGGLASDSLVRKLGNLGISMGLFGEEAKLNQQAVRDLRLEVEKASVEQEILNEVISSSKDLQKTVKLIDEASSLTNAFARENEKLTVAFNGSIFAIRDRLNAQRLAKMETQSDLDAQKQLHATLEEGSEEYKKSQVEIDKLTSSLGAQSLSVEFLSNALKTLRGIEEKRMQLLNQMGVDEQAAEVVKANQKVLESERGTSKQRLDALKNRIEEEERLEQLQITQRVARSVREIEALRDAGIISRKEYDDRVGSINALADAQRSLATATEEHGKRQAELDKVISDAGVVQSLAQTTAVLGQIFGASKEMQIAMAVIDGGAAIVKTFAQLGFPAGIPAALAVAAKTAQTIAQMKNVQPGDSTPIGGSGGGGSSTGISITDVGGGMNIATPYGSNYIPTGSESQPKFVFYNEVVASDEEIAVLTKNGEGKILNKQI